MGFLPPVVARLFADIRQYEGQMGRADGIMKGFGDTAMSTSAKVNRAANYIIGAGVAIGAVSIKMAADFQSATTRLVTDAGESVKNLDMIRKGILALAGPVGSTPKKLADGMYYIESAGYHGAQALTILKAAAEGAKVGFTDMATMASATTTVMRDYGYGANQAKNVTSGLIETVALGKTNMTLLGYSMGRVLPIAANLGIPFKEVAGAIATMTVSGQQARFSVAEIKNALLSLAAPGGKASKVMADIGVSAGQLHTALLDPKNGVANALKIIEDHLKQHYTVGSPQYVAANRAILGGITGLSVGLALGGKHLGFYADSVNKIGQAMQGNQKNVQGWAEVVKTANFQASSLSGYASSIAVSFGNALLPKVQDVMKWGAGVITWFQSHPLITKIAGKGAEDAFALAVGIKIAGYINKSISTIKTFFGAGAQTEQIVQGVTQIQLLTEIAYNTAVGAGLRAAKDPTVIKPGTPGSTEPETIWGKFTKSIQDFFKNPTLASAGTGATLIPISQMWNALQNAPTLQEIQFGWNKALTGSASKVTETVVKTKTGIRVYVTH